MAEPPPKRALRLICLNFWWEWVKKSPLPASGRRPARVRVEPSAARRRPVRWNRGSAAGEGRLALLHEGLAAFLVVGAVETLLHQLLEQLLVALARRLAELADRQLRGAHRQRRVDRELGRVVAHRRLELIARHHAVDQADLQRLLGGQAPPREQNVERDRRADQAGQPGQPGLAVGDAAARRRHAEL